MLLLQLLSVGAIFCGWRGESGYFQELHSFGCEVLCNGFAHVLFNCALEVDEDDILMLVALLGTGMGP